MARRAGVAAVAVRRAHDGLVGARRADAALALLPSRRAADELEARVPECCFVHSEAADALHAYATLGLRPKARALEFLLAKLAAPALPAGRVARALWACAVLGCVQIKSSTRLQCARMRMF